MSKFLNNEGLLYLWGKIKTYVTGVLPKKVSELENDSKFITLSDVPEGAAASNTVPKANGTASAGKEAAFARGDHVHPHDDTKVDKANGKAFRPTTSPTTTKQAGRHRGRREQPHPADRRKRWAAKDDQRRERREGLHPCSIIGGVPYKDTDTTYENMARRRPARRARAASFRLRRRALRRNICAATARGHADEHDLARTRRRARRPC
ncbi:MAG: hypothetical protein ACLTV6_06315 [Christensenellales bacterium]